MVADPEIEVVVVSYQVVYWRFSSDIPGYLERHAVWSRSALWDMHVGLVGKWTDSPNSVLDEFVVGVSINIVL